MGTLEAHSGVGVYLASFVVPKLERLSATRTSAGGGVGFRGGAGGWSEV